jgi:serine/threonine-protein kinase
VVDVLDMGTLDAGSLYIVLEHLDGVDLGLAVASERGFVPARALHVISQLCDALSAVHAAGIVHRDLKPENIFLTSRDGKRDFVKVLDFGVCKVTEKDGARLTFSGDRVGTPQFMAPEQIDGRNEIDLRTDIFALGAILHFTLTGKPPFNADSLPKLALKICNQAPPSVRRVDPALPEELDQVIHKALAKQPAQRFGNCDELKRAISALAHRLPKLVPETLSSDRWDTLPDAATLGETDALVASLKLGKRPRSKAILAGSILATVCAAALAFRFYPPASTDAVPAEPDSQATAPSARVTVDPRQQVEPIPEPRPDVTSLAQDPSAASKPEKPLPPKTKPGVGPPPKPTSLPDSGSLPTISSSVPAVTTASDAPSLGVEPDAANIHGSPSSSASGVGPLPLNRDVKRDL